MTSGAQGSSSNNNNNHLERAYEDLEKEIRDIKSKLQRSMVAGGG